MTYDLVAHSVRIVYERVHGFPPSCAILARLASLAFDHLGQKGSNDIGANELADRLLGIEGLIPQRQADEISYWGSVRSILHHDFGMQGVPLDRMVPVIAQRYRNHRDVEPILREGVKGITDVLRKPLLDALGTATSTTLDYYAMRRIPPVEELARLPGRVMALCDGPLTLAYEALHHMGSSSSVNRDDMLDYLARGTTRSGCHGGRITDVGKEAVFSRMKRCLRFLRIEVENGGFQNYEISITDPLGSLALVVRLLDAPKFARPRMLADARYP